MRVRVNIFAGEKAIIIITYTEFVFVALVIHHARRLCRILVTHVACPVLSYFPTLSYKQHDFLKKSY